MFYFFYFFNATNHLVALKHTCESTECDTCGEGEHGSAGHDVNIHIWPLPACLAESLTSWTSAHVISLFPYQPHLVSIHYSHLRTARGEGGGGGGSESNRATVFVLSNWALSTCGMAIFPGLLKTKRGEASMISYWPAVPFLWNIFIFLATSLII